MKDTEVGKLIEEENKRQHDVVNLIASENYVSEDVLAALGSVLTNKYSEGYPNARYYGGNPVVDAIETLCQDRAREVFGLSHDEWQVNVQPYSGSPAMLATYSALMELGDSFMGMELAHGGHLTHGHSVSFTGKAWKQIPYQVEEDTELLDYTKLEEQARQEKPKVIVAGFTAYPREIDWAAFRKVADAVGAYLVVDMSHIAGLVAGSVYKSPFPHADVVVTTTHKTLRGPRAAMIFARKDERELPKKIDKAVFPGLQGGPHSNQIAAVAVALNEATTEEFKEYVAHVVQNAQALSTELQQLGWRVVSGGTDTHLVLVDVWKDGKGITGSDAETRLEEEGIIVNKNTIPFDTRSPFNPSGIRLGAAAETTRGKTVKDMQTIAQKIDTILKQ